MTRVKKRIVLCSDGTGNTVMKGRGTNVFKLYEAVDLTGHKYTDPPSTQQIGFYGDGIGTAQNKLVKTLSGIVGFGLSRNVRDLYIDLCRVYEPGDEIYLFGFSRGAHTVRVLAGFILECGVIKDAASLPDHDLEKLIKKGYRTYRKRHTTFQTRQLRRARALRRVARDRGCKEFTAFWRRTLPKPWQSQSVQLSAGAPPARSPD